jgi:Spy/CpxP family protein refolding chaperone
MSKMNGAFEMRNLTLFIKKIPLHFSAALFLGAILFFVSSAAVRAQTQNAPDNDQESDLAVQNRRSPKRASLLDSLNLSVDQMQQIRSINMETRHGRRQAFQRQRAARRALDAAIYADATDQALINQRLSEFNQAQVEASKMRVAVELRVRQVLTLDQLARFREVRQNAEQVFRERKQKMPRRRKL